MSLAKIGIATQNGSNSHLKIIFITHCNHKKFNMHNKYFKVKMSFPWVLYGKFFT